MSLSKKATELKCYLNGYEKEGVRVHRVEHVTGSQQINTCYFEFHGHGSFSESLFQGKQLREFPTNDTIEVMLVGEANVFGIRPEKVIHAGQVAATDAHFDEGGEHMQFVSRLDHHLIGRQLSYIPVIDEGKWPSNLGHTFVSADGMVLNPTFDGKVRGNMINAGWPTLPGTLDFVLVDPRSLPLDPADWSGSVTYNNYQANIYFWPLPNAVKYLCDTLNSEQTFVGNPSLIHLRSVLPWHLINDHPKNKIIRDYVLPVGAALPEILDDLLEPNGYSWYIHYSSKGYRSIAVFKKGYDSIFNTDSPDLQAYGSAVSQGLSQAKAMSTRFEIVKGAANSVRVIGDKGIVESTFELVPAWDPQYDDTPRDHLSHGSLQRLANPKLDRVHRDWVLNEIGEYTELRDDILKPFPVADFFHRVLGSPVGFDWAGLIKSVGIGLIFGGLASLLSYMVVGYRQMWSFTRRRVFMPSITTDGEGRPVGDNHGYFVEWFDPKELEWKPVEGLRAGEGAFQVLENEAGIRFTGLDVPQELYSYRPNGFFADSIGNDPVTTGLASVHGAYHAYNGARIRITASLETDYRMQTVQQKTRRMPNYMSGTFLNGDANQHVVNAADRFRLIVIDKDFTAHASGISQGKLFDTAEVDEREEMNDLANSLLAEWNRGTLDGNVTLEGLVATDYDIGKVMERVGGLGGRNISLATTPDSSGLFIGGILSAFRDKGYPSIMGKSYDIDNQTTTITIGRYRKNIQ